MHAIRLVRGHGNAAGAARPSVVTIGNFDGVHHGHRALLARLVDRARQLGAPAVVYTFAPSPRSGCWPSRKPE